MKNFILLAILSFTLTACTGSSDGGDTPAANANTNPIITETPMDIPMETPPPNLENRNGLTSFEDTERNEKEVILNIDSLVQITKPTAANVNILNQNISGGLVDFAYDESGDFVAESIKVKLSNITYQLADDAPVTGNTNVYQGTSTPTCEPEGCDAPTELRFTRNTNFGDDTTPNYMVALQWKVEHDDYDAFGFGVAGFDTVAASIQKTGGTSFTGKGWGNYSDSTVGGETANQNIFFNIEAIVDFANRNVTLASNSSCDSTYDCAVNSGPDRRHLNFTGNLTYNAGTNQLSFANVTTTDNALTGSASAKFYGIDDATTTNINENAIEFGGTFNLRNATLGYVGYFGANRGYVIKATGDDVVTTTDGTAPELNVNTLANFTDSTKNGTTGNALSANFVQITRNSVDKSINNDIFTDGVVVFDYNGSNFATSGTPLTLYLGERKYWATTSNASNVSTRINSNTSTNMSNDSDVPENLYFSIDDFGFTADYMALAYYNVVGAGYASEGFGIAGFATATPLTSGTNIFTGAGWGTYSDNDANIDTKFTINATVNFGLRTVVLESTGTCVSTDCTGLARADLNFTGTLVYIDNINALASTENGITTAGGDYMVGSDTFTTASLSGYATAKFYGPQSNELGGTFSLTNPTAGYVGFFGASPYSIVVPADAVVTAETIEGVNLVGIDNSVGFTGFNDSTRGTSGKTSNNLNIDNLVRITDDSSNKAITLDSVTNALTYFTYESGGGADFYDSSSGGTFALYLENTRYSSTSADGDANTLTAGGVIGNTNINNFELNRGSNAANDIFGFTADYLALISWDEITSDATTYGYGITGYETVSIATKLATKFVGKGHGRYQNVDGTKSSTLFDTTIDVDFVNKTLDFKAENTCISGSDCLGDNLLTHLDFDGEQLTYDNTVNNLIITIATADDVLTGTADAKFYGASSNEIGGTFKLSNNQVAYGGAFGTHRYSFKNTTTATDTTIDGDTVPSLNKQGLVSWEDSNRTYPQNGNLLSKQGVVLEVPTIRYVTANKVNRTVITETISGAVIDYDYNETGNTAAKNAIDINGDDGFAFYFGDTKIQFKNGSNNSIDYDSVQVTESNPISSNKTDLPHQFRMTTSGNNPAINTIESDYMAMLVWETQGTDYDSIGFGVTGFDTAFGDIPTGAGNNVTFTGKGRGDYRNIDAAPITELRFFEVEAVVKFDAKTVDVTTTATCLYTIASICGNDGGATDYGYSASHLDMTGQLSYTNANKLTGTFTTAGDTDNATLSGDAEARFYGTGADVASELGGTFSVINDSASFIGFFGVKE